MDCILGDCGKMDQLQDLKVGVLGFGLMGAQICQTFAQRGYTVSAYDISNEKINEGLDLILNGRYGLQRAVDRGKIEFASVREILSRIQPSSSIESTLNNIDFVIEAAFESVEVKQELLRKASELTPFSTVLTTNTSTLRIEKIGIVLSPKDRKRLAGMHFFNPPQIMRLIEVVRASETDDAVVNSIHRVAMSLGKTPIIVSDCAGFVANRVGLSLFTEACELLAKKVASLSDIDTAMRLGFGHPAGPFELADVVGLDSRLRNLQALFEETGLERFRPPESLIKLVAEGYLGSPGTRKGSKGGYYEYYHISRPEKKEGQTQ